jgi:uncharacterized protein (TIGR00369 family)
MREPAIPREELVRLLAAELPQGFGPGSGLTVKEVTYRACRLRQELLPDSLRPGGTIAGPTMMMLADVAMYVALMASIGWVPLAVTTSLNINFLWKPSPGPLEAACRILKLGKRLAVGEVSIRSEGEEELVAHATTYSIPRANEHRGSTW